MEDWRDEFEPLADPELNRISFAIVGAAIDVHKSLGPGYPEAHYQRALAVALMRRGIPFIEQHPFDVWYDGALVGEGRCDFLVEGRVVVEIKSVETILNVHPAQVVSYLKATKLRLGLLINFNTKYLKDGVRRIIH